MRVVTVQTAPPAKIILYNEPAAAVRQKECHLHSVRQGSGCVENMEDNDIFTCDLLKIGTPDQT